MSRRILVVHPSPDLYGSDLQLLESVKAFRQQGWRCLVLVPKTGPLVDRLVSAGSSVEIVEFPVLRKSVLSVPGLVRFIFDNLFSVRRIVRQLSVFNPDLVYVNTLTIPIWIFVSRCFGKRVLCHVHESIGEGPALLRKMVGVPAVFANAVVANSRVSASDLSIPFLLPVSAVDVIYNGVPGPRNSVDIPVTGDESIVVFVGRLSPRKGVDLAIEALRLLRARGENVRLLICGSVFPGYEWYVEELIAAVSDGGLVNYVEFLGYVNPTWPILERANVVVVPSRQEPFGNVAVEAMLANRVVVAAKVQGLVEVVDHLRTGLLFDPGDASDLAKSICVLLADPSVASNLAAAGREDASIRFDVNRYGDELVRRVGSLLREGVIDSR